MTAPAVSMRVSEAERGALFARLVSHFNAQVDRRGWVHVTCPECGKESSRKDIHFSFSLSDGAKCFACGYTANLKQLAVKVGLDTDAPLPAPRMVVKPPVVRHYRWMDELEAYQALYESTCDRYLLWERYRGLSRELVNRYRLGAGIFPQYSSQCDHYRLMVPMLQNGAPVAFRGRSTPDLDGVNGCEHKKWLSTAMGGRAPLLYNGGVLLAEHDRALVNQYDLTDSLGPWCRDRVLIVVENPVDCLLLEARGLCVVATLGVTMWTPERPWTQLVKLAAPRRVIVMYDHDLPGNGAASEREYKKMVDAWKQAHKGMEPPISNGLRLANELNAAGVPASAYRWPESTPLKFDVGDLLSQGMMRGME